MRLPAFIQAGFLIALRISQGKWEVIIQPCFKVRPSLALMDVTIIWECSSKRRTMNPLLSGSPDAEVVALYNFAIILQSCTKNESHARTQSAGVTIGRDLLL